MKRCVIFMVVACLSFCSCRQGFDIWPDGGEPFWPRYDGAWEYDQYTPPQPCPNLDLSQGDFEGTAWNPVSGWLELDGGTYGSYVSPICDAGNVVSWHSLEVTPRMPYGKPLGPQTETGYPQGNLSVEGLVALWHLDGLVGVIPPGSVVANALPDRTGGVTQDLDATMAYIPARFGQGIDFDGIDDLVVMEDSSDFNFAYDDFTLAGWVKTTMDCGHWCGFLGRQVRADGGFTLEMNGQDQANFFLGYLTREYNNIEGGPIINDDAWHLLVGVKQGSSGTLYVDGQEVARADPLNYPRSYDSEHDFEIGGYSDNDPVIRAAAVIDEVSVWHRALDSGEVQQLFFRGGLRYRIQVRACDDPVCNAEQFVGPDITPDSWFSEELNDTLSPPVFDLENLEPSRYFQYRIVLESDDPERSPALSRVVLSGAW